MAHPKRTGPDLEARITSRKREMILEIIEHKKNPSRFGASVAVDSLKARLTDLADIVRDGVTNGWASLAPHTQVQLDAWLAR